MNLTTCQNRARDLEHKPWHSKRMSHPILCHVASTSPWLGSLKLENGIYRILGKTKRVGDFLPCYQHASGAQCGRTSSLGRCNKKICSCANTPILCVTFLFVNTAPLCVMSKCCCANTACQQCHLLRLYVRAAGMWIFQAASLEPNEVSFGPASSKSSLHSRIVEIPKK